MAAGGNFVLPTFRQGYTEAQDGGPVPALPTYRPPNESGHVDGRGGYPLAMMSPKSHSFLNSTYPNHRRQAAREGEQKVVLHPADAEARGIAHNDAVRVFNDRGAFVAVARVGEDTIPGVVIAPMGHCGHLAGAGHAGGAQPHGNGRPGGCADLFRQPRRGEPGLSGPRPVVAFIFLIHLTRNTP